MKHEKQRGSGNPLFKWACIGACAAPAVGLALFAPDSRWFSAVLMLAVCGGAHFLMTRGTGAREQSAVRQGEKGVPAPQAASQAPDSETFASNDAAHSPERQTRDAA